jgi:hypothetical protein
MNPQAVGLPSWSTASLRSTADTSKAEWFALGEHLDLCQGCRGRLFALHCMAEAVNGFVAARVVTTLTMLALVIGAVSLVS